MSDHNQLAGKVALITGAGGAIGAATALLMLARGASVVAVDRATTSLGRLGARRHACATEGLAAWRICRLRSAT